MVLIVLHFQFLNVIYGHWSFIGALIKKMSETGKIKNEILGMPSLRGAFYDTLDMKQRHLC